MRTLIVSMRFPDDPKRRVHGVFQRLELFIQALKGLGELDLLFFVEPRIDVSSTAVDRYRNLLAEHYGAELNLTLVTRQPPTPRSRWETYGAGIFDAYRQWNFRSANGLRQVEALEAALDRGPDLLFVHRMGPMAAVHRARRSLPRICLDLDDVEHLSFARSISQPPTWPGKRLYTLQVPALWLAERRAIATADRSFVCSEEDRAYLARTMRVDGVTVVPNAVEMPELCDASSEPTALFLGMLGYAPNRNAATFLLREIWPRVKKLVPGARLLVAGGHPEGIPGYPDGGDGVEFTGFVEDLPKLYARIQVTCVPILTGGGTRFKIIESASYARPTVSTTLGAEGLAMKDGRDILLRDDPEEFARALADLLVDQQRARELGLAAREAVLHTYAKQHVIAQIQEEIRQVMDAG